MKRTTRVMLLLALATMLLVFHVNTTSAKLTLLGGPTIVEAAHGSQSATSPRILLSDTDNTRGYELGVGGIGFTGGTAAAVYVLHDSSVAPSVLDDGANEAALCQRIINQGASFGSAIVDSDGLVEVFGMVSVPTFIPGNHNYICMVDGAGRMSGTDVERFHLEHSIRVVPSAVTAGDSVTIFAQDYPSPGAGLTTLRVSGRSIAASSSSSVGADWSATVTFTIPSDLEGAVLVEAAWGNVSGTTRLVVTAAHFGELATRPSMVSASYAAETGAVEVTWKPDTTARQHWVVLFSLPDYEHGGRVLVRGVDADSVVFQDVPPGRYEALVASYSKDVGFKYGDDTTFELTIVAQEFDAATDRAALVDFYNATGGANWTNHANWLSNAPLGEWHGVNTDDAGRVTDLRLLENGLIGTISGTLGNLSNLVYLNLGDNELTGTIPVQLQNLGNLQQFYLWNNRLTGPVPAWLGNLTNLKRLGLSKNELNGTIPGTLGNLSNLNLINFGGNELTGPIPTELRNLSNLEELNLWNNQLTGPVPSWLGSLGNLTRISLQGNHLFGQIPPTLGNLSALTHLNLSDNLLTSQIPPELGNLAKLEFIRMSGNEFTGCIPQALQRVADNDLASANIPICAAAAVLTYTTELDPVVPYLTWQIGDDMPQDRREAARRGVHLMHNYATNLGLPDINVQTTYYLFYNQKAVNQAYARLKGFTEEQAAARLRLRNIFGEAGYGFIFINGARFDPDNFSNDRLTGTSAHELAHVHQYTGNDLGNIPTPHDRVRVSGPAWLSEGGADFQEARALAQGGVIQYTDSRAEFVRQANRIADALTLPDLATYDGLLPVNGGYAFSALAVELLVSRSSERALVDYWTELGPDTTWQQEFAAAFGVNVNDFYTRYANHRANGYRGKNG